MDAIVNVFHRLAADGYENFATPKLPSGAVQLFIRVVRHNATMNYLSHGFRFVHDPYFVAGTALPDWMSVLDRRNRARSAIAAELVDDADANLAAMARGVMRIMRMTVGFIKPRPLRP